MLSDVCSTKNCETSKKRFQLIEYERFLNHSSSTTEVVLANERFQVENEKMDCSEALRYRVELDHL